MQNMTRNLSLSYILITCSPTVEMAYKSCRDGPEVEVPLEGSRRTPVYAESGGALGRGGRTPIYAVDGHDGRLVYDEKHF